MFCPYNRNLMGQCVRQKDLLSLVLEVVDIESTCNRHGGANTLK